MDFEQKARGDYYETKLPYKEDKVAYRTDQGRLTGEFYADAKAYAVRNGVPEQYASKVVGKAWESGHAYGFGEVLNHLDGLIEIFN